MLSKQRRDVKPDLVAHAIRLHTAVANGDRDAAEAVRRSFGSDTIHVGKVLAAEVAHV